MPRTAHVVMQDRALQNLTTSQDASAQCQKAADDALVALGDRDSAMKALHSDIRALEDQVAEGKQDLAMLQAKFEQATRFGLAWLSPTPSPSPSSLPRRLPPQLWRFSCTALRCLVSLGCKGGSLHSVHPIHGHGLDSQQPAWCSLLTPQPTPYYHHPMTHHPAVYCSFGCGCIAVAWLGSLRTPGLTLATSPTHWRKQGAAWLPLMTTQGQPSVSGTLSGRLPGLPSKRPKVGASPWHREQGTRRQPEQRLSKPWMTRESSSSGRQRQPRKPNSASVLTFIEQLNGRQSWRLRF